MRFSGDHTLNATLNDIFGCIDLPVSPGLYGSLKVRLRLFLACDKDQKQQKGYIKHVRSHR